MTNTFKENIYAFIEAQVPLLLEPYVKEIDSLKNEKASLQQQVEQLSKEVLQLKKQLHTKTETIDDEIINWFENYIEALRNNHKKLCAALKPELQDRLLEINTIKGDAFFGFVKKIVGVSLSTQNDQLLEVVLMILLQAQGAREQDVINYFKTNSQFLNRNVKNPNLCNTKIQLLMKYNLPTKTRTYINLLLNEYSQQVLAELNAVEFAQLFWYSFLHHEEKRFLKVFAHKKQALSTDSMTALYFKSLENGMMDSILNLYKMSLRETNILSNEQLISVYKKIDNPAVAESIGEFNDQTSHRNYFPKNSLYVVKDAALQTFKEHFLLQPGIITMELFEGNSRLKSREVRLAVLLNELKDTAYIAEKDFKQYKDAFSPYKLQASMHYYNYVWPTTDIAPASPVEKNLTASASSEEKGSLNEKSKLKEMGYHYTKNEPERWGILRRAVNLHGLHSVASTLASNTRRLKGRAPESPAILV